MFTVVSFVCEGLGRGGRRKPLQKTMMNSQKLREARDRWKRRKEAAAFYGISSYMDASWLKIDENDNVEVSLSSTIAKLPSPLDFIETLHLDPVEEGEEEEEECTDDEAEEDQEDKTWAIPQPPPSSCEIQSSIDTTKELLMKDVSSVSDDNSSCTALSQESSQSARLMDNEAAGERLLDTCIDNSLTQSLDSEEHAHLKTLQKSSDSDDDSLDGFFRGQFSFAIQSHNNPIERRESTASEKDRKVASRVVEPCPDLKETHSSSSCSQTTEDRYASTTTKDVSAACKKQNLSCSATTFGLIEERIQVTPMSTKIQYWKPEKRKRAYWIWFLLLALLAVVYVLLSSPAFCKDQHAPARSSQEEQRNPTERKTPEWRQLKTVLHCLLQLYERYGEYFGRASRQLYWQSPSKGTRPQDRIFHEGLLV